MLASRTNRYRRTAPEAGLVLHAQFQIILVQAAVLLQKDSARGRVLQKLRVKVSDDAGNVLLDDEARLTDRGRVFRRKPDEFGHELEVAAGVGRASLKAFLRRELFHERVPGPFLELYPG